MACDMLAKGYISEKLHTNPYGGIYQYVSYETKGEQMLRSTTPYMLASWPKKRKRAKSTTTENEQQVAQNPFHEALLGWRTKLSEERKCSAHTLINGKQLDAVVEGKPMDLKALKEILGQGKLKRVGYELMLWLNEYYVAHAGTAAKPVTSFTDDEKKKMRKELGIKENAKLPNMKLKLKKKKTSDDETKPDSSTTTTTTTMNNSTMDDDVANEEAEIPDIDLTILDDDESEEEEEEAEEETKKNIAEQDIGEMEFKFEEEEDVSEPDAKRPRV